MRSSRRERSTSETSAFEISFSDSSCFSQRVAASYSRAFSIATAACDESSVVELLVLVGERGAALLLGQVQVAVGDSAQEDRDAEERAHRRMVRREADRARVVREIVEAQRLRVLDQRAEDAAATREVADRRLRLGDRCPVTMNRSSAWPLGSMTPSAAYRAPVSSAAVSTIFCRTASSDSSEASATPASTIARNRSISDTSSQLSARINCPQPASL